MRWMEFIRVQTAKSNMGEKLTDLVAECKDSHGLLEAKIFNHVTVGDCSVCLCWNTDQPESRGSSIGLSLSNILKNYGLVNHSVWLEIKNIGENKHENESN